MQIGLLYCSRSTRTIVLSASGLWQPLPSRLSRLPVAPPLTALPSRQMPASTPPANTLSHLVPVRWPRACHPHFHPAWGELSICAPGGVAFSTPPRLRLRLFGTPFGHVVANPKMNRPTKRRIAQFNEVHERAPLCRPPHRGALQLHEVSDNTTSDGAPPERGCSLDAGRRKHKRLGNAPASKVV